MDVDSMDFNVMIASCETLIIRVGVDCFKNVYEKCYSHLSQIDILIIIAKFVSVSFLHNFNLTLLAKSSRLMVRNLTTHCVTHGLSHYLDTSLSILKISNQNKVFSFNYLEKRNLKEKIS